MNPFHALQAVVERRRLRRIAKRRLAQMLRRDGMVKIYVQQPGDGGVPLAERPLTSTYRISVRAEALRRAS